MEGGEKMNLIEKIKGHAREINYELSRTIGGIECDPERIAAFPAHKTDCSRTKPLTIMFEGNFALPSGGGVPADPGRVTKVITECIECGGRREE